MSAPENTKIGYVVKRYPRFSETFIVNEILAHEEAGWNLDIFALRPCCDAHFQDRIARVRAPVSYLPAENPKSSALWSALQRGQGTLPGFDDALADCLASSAPETHQALHLAEAVRRRGIGHLHAHFATSAAEVARLAARLSGVSWSLTAHAKDIFHDEVRRDDLQRKLTSAAAVVTVSDFNLRYLRSRFPAAGERIVRLFNGIDLEQFAFDSPRKRSPLVVGVGRLVEKKGFGDLVAACAVLKGQGRTFRCRIIGDGELEPQLRQQIAQSNLGQFVELTGGLPQAEVIRCVQAAAAVAAPCVIGRDGNRDGMPTVLLEAMGLGTPCVATDVTGIPEIIIHGETGWMVPQHDGQQLAAALGRLLDDADMRIQLAHAARARIERDFDIRANAQTQRELFAAAMASGRTDCTLPQGSA